MRIPSSVVNLICVCLIKLDTLTRSGWICNESGVNDTIFLLNIFVDCGVDGIFVPPVVVVCSAAAVFVTIKLVGGI